MYKLDHSDACNRDTTHADVRHTVLRQLVVLESFGETLCKALRPVLTPSLVWVPDVFHAQEGPMPVMCVCVRRGATPLIAV